MCFLIAADMRTDLSDLKPRSTTWDDDARLIGWSQLGADRLPEGRVRMLGYMMDGYKYARDGVPVAMFVLMPGAGHFMHPAHRDPDQMVEVWPKPGHVVFKNRELVRASGTFVRVPGPLREEHAQYALYNASVTPASYGDIANWFVP